LIGLVVFGLVATATIGRIVLRLQTPGPFDTSNQGLCDFHNGIYFPATALLDGVSPYGHAYTEQYPVARQIPFFSPGILLLHAPLTWMPLRAAEVVYTCLNFCFVILIAATAVVAAGLPRRMDAIIWVGVAILVSRAGHITIFTGYFTFELVLATFAAIAWGQRSPWKAAFALAIVSAKPTYILPIGFLLLARGNYRALILGAVISIAFAALPFSYLAWHEGAGDLVEGSQALVQQIGETQAIHQAQFDESPIYSWTRLDLLAVVAKWGGFDPGHTAHLASMMLFLALPMFALYRRSRAGMDDGLGGLTGALILVSSLVSIYHQSYDALLMVVPATTILAGRRSAWRDWPIPLRGAAVTFACWPAYNLLSTRMFLLQHDPSLVEFCVVTSLSGLALTSLLSLLLGASWWNGRRGPSESSHSSESTGWSEPRSGSPVTRESDESTVVL